MGIGEAIVTAVVTALGATGTAATLITIGVKAVIGLTTSFALGALQKSLTPSPSSNLSSGFASSAQGITQNVQQAITSRRIVYGESRVGGAVTFMETSENDKYLHMIIVLADHECEEIGEVWLNDVSIPEHNITPGTGNVNAGTYKDKVRIKKYLGTASQTADTDLVAETSVDSTFKGTGVAYLYVRLEYDRNVFPSNIPTITAWVKGKKVYDPRTTATAWSCNAALIVNDYLTESNATLTPGVGASQSDVDETTLIASANTCEEYVTVTEIDETIDFGSSAIDAITLRGVNDRLQFMIGDKVNLIGSNLPGGLAESTDYYVIPYQRTDALRVRLATSLENAFSNTYVTITSSGGGTMRKIAEPRYFSDGVIETSETPEQNMTDLLSACAGNAVYIGGKWHINAASYKTPVVEFDENHIISPIIVRSKVSRRDRFNTVTGVYVSPINDGVPTDYPHVTNAGYVTADNGVTLPTNYDLPKTQRPHAGQRMAKIKLEKHRQEIFFEARFSLHAMQVQPGDNILFSNDRMGWDQKVFEVVNWSLGVDESNNSAPVFYVKMSLQETAAAVYDWNNGEETVTDPAINTDLPNPFVVTVVSGFSLDSIPVNTQDGDKTLSVKATWNSHESVFVTQDGRFEIEYKETTDTFYNSAGKVDGNITEMILPTLKPDVLYDVRIFAFNNLGVRSQETLVEDFQVGSSITTNTEDWESENLTRDGDDWETDTATSEDWET